MKHPWFPENQEKIYLDYFVSNSLLTVVRFYFFLFYFFCCEILNDSLMSHFFKIMSHILILSL